MQIIQVTERLKKGSKESPCIKVKPTHAPTPTIPLISLCNVTKWEQNQMQLRDLMLQHMPSFSLRSLQHMLLPRISIDCVI